MNNFSETRKTLINDSLFEAYVDDKEEYCGGVSGPWIFDYVYTYSRQNITLFGSFLDQDETEIQVKGILATQGWQFKGRENLYIFGPTDLFQKNIDGINYEIEINWNNLGLGDLPVTNMNFSTKRYNDSEWEEKYDIAFDQITQENRKEIAKAINPKLLDAKSVFMLRNIGHFNDKSSIEKFLNSIQIKPRY